MAIELGSVFPSLGASLGTGVGAGVNEALDLLAQQKAQQLQSQHQKNLLAEQQGQLSSALTSLGVPKEISSALALFSPQERFAALKTLQAPTPAGMTVSELFTTPAERERILAGQRAAERLQQQEKSAQDIQKRFEEGLKFRQEQADIKNQQFNALQGIREAKTEQERNKYAHQWSEPYIKAAESAERDIRDYTDLINLAETNELRTGAGYQLMKKLGMEEFGANLYTQLASKIIGRTAQNFNSSGLASARGATNFLEQTFQRGLATLGNTPEGIIAISKMFIESAQLPIVKNKVREELMKKWKGNIPYNADDIIREKAEKEGAKVSHDIIKLGQEAMQQFKKKSGEEEVKVGTKLSAISNKSQLPIGTIRTNKKTGERQEWNGTKFVAM